MGYKRNHVSLIHGNTESHEPSCGICTKTYDYTENTLFQWGHWFFSNFTGMGISKFYWGWNFETSFSKF